MSYEDSVYNYPEKFDLEIVGALHDPNADYSFNDLVVWQHTKTKRLYWATDSGCSCPSPFEDYNKLEDLTLITDKTWHGFVGEVKEHAIDWDSSPGDFQCDKNQLMAKVNALFRPPTKQEMDEAIEGLKRIAESLPQ